MQSVSLRERKKAATKTTIAVCAAKLFSSKGYAKTTLADIAAAANVSPRTIFLYFPSKETIIFDHDQQFVNSVIEYLENRGGASVFDAIRSFLITNRESLTKKSSAHEAEKRALVNANPALQSHASWLLQDFEQKLVALVAAERGIADNSLHAHIIAAIFRASFTFIPESCEDQDKEAMFETVLQFIDAGLAATTPTKA